MNTIRFHGSLPRQSDGLYYCLILVNEETVGLTGYGVTPRRAESAAKRMLCFLGRNIDLEQRSRISFESLLAAQSRLLKGLLEK